MMPRRCRRRSLLAWAFAPLGLLLLSPAAGAGEKKTTRPPNIVVILMDDLGWADLGCYGSKFYETPNLDRLAKKGMRFTHAYTAAPVCSPTRASIMTGKHPARLHLTNFLVGNRWPKDSPLQPVNWQTNLPAEEVTFAQLLRAAGYATGYIGKWHLGKLGPEHFGFQRDLSAKMGPVKGTHFTKDGDYLPDHYTALAEDFLAKNKDRPFLLCLAHNLVHIPLSAKKDLIAKYEAKAQANPPARAVFGKDSGVKVREVQNHAVYAAMVQSMDESVGRILKKLADLGLDNDTVVIFTSDNGGLCSAEGWPTANLPLRLGKGWLYEGGVRVPLIVRWPGKTRPGSTSDVPVVSTDLYPTILEIAGVPLRPKQHLDGVSIAPLLQGTAGIERQALYWHYPHYSNQGGPPSGAVRRGDWKLIEFYEDGRLELYNLRDDPGEHTNLAARVPERARELRLLLHTWRQSVGAQIPQRKG
jgi:arylsulfatase A-like enzyme